MNTVEVSLRSFMDSVEVVMLWKELFADVPPDSEFVFKFKEGVQCHCYNSTVALLHYGVYVEALYGTQYMPTSRGLASLNADIIKETNAYNLYSVQMK